ncbi:YceD family protein [Roseicyclus sp.]|uniref:YceD family protein n=1 Tax=Roseicyclus sp. TaxID=1914329 RepID=UPI003F6CB34B
MADTPERIVLARLPRGADFSFDLAPDATARAALAAEFGLLALRKLRFSGRLVAEGKRDWALQAALGATVVQPCVVTAEPVTTRIDDPVTRRYLADMPEPEGDEAEIPNDDTLEPLPEILTLTSVMAEALALALPLYPRAAGAALSNTRFAPPGVAPLDDDAAKPLAGLAALRDKLAGQDKPEKDG